MDSSERIVTEIQNWLQRCRDNQEDLKSFIKNWHPRSKNKSKTRMVITAPSAEAACETVRKQIEKEPGDPVQQFEGALKEGNINEINTLLNDAWFGVPESTECWNIPGFEVAVDLMESLP